jgi:hypothetical protein
MQQLRERGVYALLDESEVVAVANIRGAYLLYDPQDWELYPHVQAIYEVYASGSIHYRGKQTYWRIEDLSDTGRTAPHGKS